MNTNMRAKEGPRLLQFGSAAVVLATLAAASFAASPSHAQDSRSLDGRTTEFVARLRDSYFKVDEGSFEIFGPEDCAALPRCWANNPTTPYGFFLLPVAPGEPDPDPDEIGPGRYPLRSIWRLRPNEAIVFIGTTPPESPYFSFTHYIFSRFSPRQGGEPPYDDRVEIFASLGDSANNVTLNTSASSREDPFNKEMALIVTADQGTDRSIRDHLAASGIPESIVTTLVIAQFEPDGVTPLARMGFENEADVFSVLMRIAHFDNQTEDTDIRQWLDDPGGRVFRARPRRNTIDPLPFQPLRPEGTGEPESSGSLRRLVRAFRARYPSECSYVHWANAARKEDGYLCMDTLLRCLADCRDTPYMGGQFKLGPSPEAIIVAGVNHELTGKASYVNITVTRLSDITAFYSVVMPDLEGSAELYIPRDPNRDTVWQVKFARECNGEPFCFEVTREQVPFDALLNITVRAYLEPATGTSAKVFPYRESEIVFPRMIKVGCDSKSSTRIRE